MKCNLPRSYNQLPQAEKDAIQEAFNEQLNHLLDKEEAEAPKMKGDSDK